jgi:hypothetical protein
VIGIPGNKTFRNTCRGCATYEFITNSKDDCMPPRSCKTYEEFNIVIKCPCEECIVKSTCTDVCDERYKFTQKMKYYRKYHD